MFKLYLDQKSDSIKSDIKDIIEGKTKVESTVTKNVDKNKVKKIWKLPIWKML